jgi:Ca2+-binding RTX toxin-like protein
MPNLADLLSQSYDTMGLLKDERDDVVSATTSGQQTTLVNNIISLCTTLVSEVSPIAGISAAIANPQLGLALFPLALAADILATKNAVSMCTLIAPSLANQAQNALDALTDVLVDIQAEFEQVDFDDLNSALTGNDLEALADAANQCLVEFGFSNVSVDESGNIVFAENTSHISLNSWISDFASTFAFGQELAQYSPLVFDLDGDGVELASLSGVGAAPVYWDMDNDGFAEASGWVKPDDGLLVRDLNSNGTIDSQNELFGDAATDGFTALTALDSNSDNQITSSDTNFSSLKIWKDLNQDGISQTNELSTLASLGITSISLSDSTVNYDLAGNHVSHESTFVIGGNTRTVVDAWFKYDSVNTVSTGSHNLERAATALPELRGYGNISDLTIAMSENSELLDKVRELAELDIVANPADVAGIVCEIIHLWGEVEGVDPEIRGTASGWVDADGRDIAFIEKLVDDLAVPNDPEGWVSGPRGLVYEDMFREFTTAATARLLLQSSGADFFETAPVYDPVADTFSGSFTLDWDAIEDALDGKSFADVVATWSNILSMLVGSVGVAGIDPTTKTALNTAINDSDPNHVLTFDSFVSQTINYNVVFPNITVPGGTYTGDPGLGIVMGVGDVDIHTGTGGAETIDLYSLIGLSPQDQIILAGDGNDTLRGAYGNDTLFGQGGNDTFENLHKGINKAYGGAGDDTFIVNGDDKTPGGAIDGGTGTNLLIGSDDFSYLSIANIQTLELSGNIKLTAAQLAGVTTVTTTSAGVRTIDAASAGTYDISAKAASTYIIHMRGTTGNDTLTGNDSTQTLSGANADGIDSGDDVLSGRGGDDTLLGVDGNDTLIGGAGADSMSGGNGNDRFVVSGSDVASGESMNGGAGTNTIEATNADLSLATLTSIQALDAHTGTVKVSAAQFSALTTFNAVDGSTTIEASAAGTYSLASKTLAGTVNLLGSSGNDTLIGVSGAQTLSGAAGDDYIEAHSGADFVYGGADADSLHGFADNDTVSGGTGNDTVSGGAGADQLNGDDGTDTIDGGDDADTIDGGAGDDIAYAGGGDDSIYGGTGTDQLYGYIGNDIIDGGDGTDTLRGEAGNDTVQGGNDNDNLYGADGDDALSGDAGEDYIEGNVGADTIYGGSEVDSLHGLENNDTIYGGTGGDTLSGAAGTDALNGGDNNDTLDGGDDADTLHGDNGDDTVYAGGGNDVIYGDAGNDYLLGYTGDDTVYGGDGTDTIYGEAGNDTINGDADADSLHGFESNDIINGGTGGDTLSGAAGTDQLNGGDDNDTLDGGDDADTLHGDNGNDTIYAGGGNDVIYGDAGADTLLGYIGNDTISGGSGNDTLSGEAGDDIFIFGTGYGNDTITDMNSSGDDTINLAGSGLANYTALQAVMTQSGSDVLITLNGSDTLVIANKTLAQLNSSDFAFA